MTPLEFARRQRVYIRQLNYQRELYGGVIAQIATFSFWNDPSKRFFKRSDFVPLYGEVAKPKKAIKFSKKKQAFLDKKFNS